MTGKFISFEGPDGAGKTSVISAVQADLERQLGKSRVMYTREPGGNHISEQIRRVLFDDQNTDMDEPKHYYLLLLGVSILFQKLFLG